MKRIVTFSVVLLLLVGCSPPKPSGRAGEVTGKLLYKGKPVNGATLRLVTPTSVSPYIFAVAQDGTFHIRDIPDNTYTVIVAGNPGAVSKQATAQGEKTEPTIPFPDNYKDAKSPLQLKVGQTAETKDLVLED